jgi:hypothetical protein
MVGVMAVSSHPATTTAGVVGGSCDVASGERVRERLTASGGQSRASIVRGPVRRAEWHCRQATPLASKTKKSKRKHQIRAKKGLKGVKCMRLWASGSVHQRVPRRSSSATEGHTPAQGNARVSACTYSPTPFQAICRVALIPTRVPRAHGAPRPSRAESRAESRVLALFPAQVRTSGERGRGVARARSFTISFFEYNTESVPRWSRRTELALRSRMKHCHMYINVSR